MPPAVAPSNLLIAAVTAFRTLVNNIQGSTDPATQVQHTIASLGDIANILERVAVSNTNFEQHFGQMDQRIGQQNSINQQVVQQIQDVRHIAQTAQTTAEEAKDDAQDAAQNTRNTNVGTKPLCESRSVANLKILSSTKERIQKLERETHKRHHAGVWPRPENVHWKP